jgi:hypothetical protein
LSNSSPSSTKDSTTSLSDVYLPVHYVPLFGSLFTSAIMASVTGTFMPRITETPSYKFCKNVSATFISNPCSLLKYCIHPRWCRISLAWLVTCNNVGL